MKEINISKLDELIKNGDVLVYFYADWCSKCKMVSLELEKLNNLNIVKVNADDSREICKKYLVMSLPTLIYFKKDGSYNSLTGLVNSEDVLNLTKK